MISYKSFVKLYSFFSSYSSFVKLSAFGDFDNQIETRMQSIVHHENERESQKSFSGDPDFIQNYFLLKRMFDFFDTATKDTLLR